MTRARAPLPAVLASPPAPALAAAGLALAILAPVAAGLWQTLRAAFGIVPALGAVTPSLAPWHQLLSQPGLATSLRLTLVTGIVSTLVALVLALAVAAGLEGDRRGGRRATRLLAPVLATPHAAMAIGLAFLIAPSGWLARLLSPWLTGWQLPPDIASVNDSRGLALILGLVVKETPFLILVTLAAQGQVALRATLAAGRALGYGRAQAWALLVLPQVYRRIRLPVFIVLAFGLSVVDMAIVLGPSNPPTLAVALTRWFLSPDPDRLMPASAGAVLQLGIVAAALALWRMAESAAAAIGRRAARTGRRLRAAEPLAQGLAAIARVTLWAGLLALGALLLWSVAWRWSFPHALPQGWSLARWLHPAAAGWAGAAGATLAIGMATTLLSLALAIAVLEAADRAGTDPGSGLASGLGRALAAAIYLPLIVPQIGFLYGLDIAFLRLGLPEGAGAVIWAQTLFVFPYVMIVLSDPWRALDPRFPATAAALGAGPWRRLVAVKLPILLRPLLTAAAVGFAVSVAQYLPTLFLGAGRIATLTTEAVTLSSGADRRVVAVYAVLQGALPLLAFGLALAVPALLHRNRRGLKGGLA